MKSVLMVAALLAGIAVPALAEDAAVPPPSPQTQAALAPSQQGSAPDVLPQSKPEPEVPMSTMLDSNGPPPSRGGCHHDAQQVYLTN
ncbi:hypothetical protein [Aestuariivirga sp.]|uniref:hypothetical protein n=1 Tax=Aestuariivirga sp. TaxID=2650926 RepID=UPI0035AFA70E